MFPYRFDLIPLIISSKPFIIALSTAEAVLYVAALGWSIVYKVLNYMDWFKLFIIGINLLEYVTRIQVLL